jgi:hypothetical protein
MLADKALFKPACTNVFTAGPFRSTSISWCVARRTETPRELSRPAPMFSTFAIKLVNEAAECTALLVGKPASFDQMSQ